MSTTPFYGGKSAVDVIVVSDFQFDPLACLGDSAMSDMALHPDMAEPTQCTILVRHDGSSNFYHAFKILTTRPTCYIVRPNVGIVAPGTTESIQITLSENYEKELSHMHSRTLPSQNDYSVSIKERFKVQSSPLPPQYTETFIRESGWKHGSVNRTKQQIDEIRRMWDAIKTEKSIKRYEKTAQLKIVWTMPKPVEGKVYAFDEEVAKQSDAVSNLPATSRHQDGASTREPKRLAKSVSYVDARRPSSSSTRPSQKNGILRATSSQSFMGAVPAVMENYDAYNERSQNPTNSRPIQRRSSQVSNTGLNRDIQTMSSGQRVDPHQLRRTGTSGTSGQRRRQSVSVPEGGGSTRAPVVPMTGTRRSSTQY